MFRRTILTQVVCALMAVPAVAQVNAGFETGNLTGWAGSGASVVTSHTTDLGATYTAPEGTYFARIIGGCSTNSISQTFNVNAGQTITGSAAFDARDYIPYDDNARVATVMGAVTTTLWYQNIYAIGSYADTPWASWSFTAPATGTIQLVYSVSNNRDCALSSYGLFDADICADADGDSVCDDVDNCVNTANADQSDVDGDGVGDVCDNCASAANTDQADGDADGVGNVCDNCANVANSDQADNDADGLGNVCDNCADVANADQANADGDAEGDACDICPFDPENDADGDSVCGDVDYCAGTTSDTDAGVPSQGLGVNRFADLEGDGIFNTVSPKGKGPQKSYTIADTAGCSCAQIIAAQGLGAGHTKFGCSISAMDDWLAFLASL